MEPTTARNRKGQAWNKNSLILWEGKSRINGRKIVGILSGLEGSANRKTGNMLQTYILCQASSPMDSVKSGADRAICGDCPFRAPQRGSAKGRACYVNIGKGPQGIWKSYMAGRIRRAGEFGAPTIREAARGRTVRVGTYGDPVAVPIGIWWDLLVSASGHTGYTHQWEKDLARGYGAFLCASIGGQKDRKKGDPAGKGWSYFRALSIGEALRAGEIACPADRGIQCQDCRLCRGRMGGEAPGDCDTGPRAGEEKPVVGYMGR